MTAKFAKIRFPRTFPCLGYSKIRLFADDALIYKDIRDPIDSSKLQEDLDSMGKWAKEWHLTFNTSKCEACLISKAAVPTHTYTMYGEPISQVNSFKYLGVTFESTLKFDDHISKAIAKSNALLGMLWRNLRGCSSRVKSLAYQTICRPTLEYASSVWSPYSRGDIARLERAQRKAYRWVFNIPRSDPISESVEEQGWKTLETRRRDKDCSLAIKVSKDMIHLDLKQYHDTNKMHNTRDGRIRRRHNTNMLRHSFFNRVLSYK